MTKSLITTFRFTGQDSCSESVYEVISFEFGFYQAIDNNSYQPSSRVTLNQINLTVKGNNGVEFFDWMISRTDRKECTIEFQVSESETRKIVVKDALCVAYNERFECYSGSAHMFNVGISAEEIQVNNMTYNVWDSMNS